jgi:hypothetical protein
MMVAGNTGGGDSVVALAAWYALANLLALAEFHLVERPSRINLEDTREAQRVEASQEARREYRKAE